MLCWRAPIMSMSSGPSTAAVKADDLKKLAILVAERRPWYEALGMTAERASGILGEDGNDYVSEQGSGLVRKTVELVCSAADVDALKPVCVVFKALYGAVKDAATNRDDLIDLIGYGVLIVKSIPETGPTSGLSPAVKHALEKFGAEVESVVQLAGSFGITPQPTASRLFPFWRNAEIKRKIQGHVTRFDRILRVMGAGAAVQSVEQAKAILNKISNLEEFISSALATWGVEWRKALRTAQLSFAAVFGAVLLVCAALFLRPEPLPDIIAVPTGALALPHSYVERAAVQEVAVGLANPEEPRAPYTVVGMGGAGKSVLASAVVRESSVRKHFLGGIFWVRVGRGAKNSLVPLLQGLAREMGAAPTDTPHGVFNSLEQVKQHMTTVASTGTYPRLVVLDDVWEREVVDALLPLGLKVLVTTRDRSIVGVPGGCLELGDMTEEEALELLRQTSRTVGQPGDRVRTQMTKVMVRLESYVEVVTLCGRLPLVLAIAGSIPVVKGRGLTAGSWGKLIEELENVATTMEASHEDSNSLNVVLETSFNALTLTKKREFKKMAVLAPGAAASTEMLLNLWETEDTGGTREEADGLVSKCLLQKVGDGGYRVHDLVLEFVKIKIKTDVGMVGKATALQAHYLGRLTVVKSYENPEHGAGNQGLFVLDALWRSVEKLSGDPELEVASYCTSLGELESCEATADVASSFSSVGFLFNIQGKFTEAEPLYGRAQAIQEKVFGPEDLRVAASLHNRALLLDKQGKYAEAEPLYERCQAIYQKKLGPEQVATTLCNRAEMLYQQGKYEDADPLYKRAAAINEAVLGPEHPRVAADLNNRAGRAGLLESQGKLSEAEALYKRTQEIFEKSLEQDHPNVATILNHRAVLFYKQENYREAIPILERALKILSKKLGENHPDTVGTRNNLEAVRQKV